MLDQCAVGGKRDEQFVDEVREHHGAEILNATEHAHIAGGTGIEKAADDIAELRILVEPASHGAPEAAGPDDQNTPNVDPRLCSAEYELAFCGSPPGESHNAEHSGAPDHQARNFLFTRRKNEEREQGS